MLKEVPGPAANAQIARPLSPMPVTVAEGAFHRPLFVTTLGEQLGVDSIDQQWRNDAEP